VSENLGKINKPLADEVRGERRLFYVPLVGVWLEAQKDRADAYNRYWEQVETHLQNLERKLGGVKRVYHEFLLVSGEEGLNLVKAMSASSTACIEPRLKQGASIEHLEDTAILSEFLDWSRCISLGLQSQAAREKVQADYTSANQRRNDYIIRRIDETLQPGESGILFMREDHQLQFPSDIQIFYVSPPALDELKRWLREEDEKARREASAQRREAPPEAAPESKAENNAGDVANKDDRQANGHD
jgi:hypothetical protein